MQILGSIMNNRQKIYSYRAILSFNFVILSINSFVFNQRKRCTSYAVKY